MVLLRDGAKRDIHYFVISMLNNKIQSRVFVFLQPSEKLRHCCPVQSNFYVMFPCGILSQKIVVRAMIELTVVQLQLALLENNL